MKRVFQRLLFVISIGVAVLYLIAGTQTRADTISVVVVSSCGTPPQTLTPGQFYPLFMDTTGTLCAAGGGGGGGTIAVPYSYTAMGGAQYNQAATTSTALTVPSGAKYARICALGGQMNFVDATNGTPTTGTTPTVGSTISAGSCIFEQGPTVLSAFRLINAVASTGVWTATYFQ